MYLRISKRVGPFTVGQTLLSTSRRSNHASAATAIRAAAKTNLKSRSEKEILLFLATGHKDLVRATIKFVVRSERSTPATRAERDRLINLCDKVLAQESADEEHGALGRLVEAEKALIVAEDKAAKDSILMQKVACVVVPLTILLMLSCYCDGSTMGNILKTISATVLILAGPVFIGYKIIESGKKRSFRKKF